MLTDRGRRCRLTARTAYLARRVRRRRQSAPRRFIRPRRRPPPPSPRCPASRPSTPPTAAARAPPATTPGLYPVADSRGRIGPPVCMGTWQPPWPKCVKSKKSTCCKIGGNGLGARPRSPPLHRVLDPPLEKSIRLEEAAQKLLLLCKRSTLYDVTGKGAVEFFTCS